MFSKATEIWKSFVAGIIDIDEKLGFKKFLRYVLVGFLILLVFNYKTVVRTCIEVITEIESDIHNQKIELRDQLLAELYPMLSEFRSDIRADRVLYFEYHNSKENLVSIPFKYVELVQQSARYGVATASEERYKDINTGAITNIYEDIKLGDVIVCNGPDDRLFKGHYPGVYELINSRDESTVHAYVSIPGIDQPIGMIILEWMDPKDRVTTDEELQKISLQYYIPRINALILSKSNRR